MLATGSTEDSVVTISFVLRLSSHPASVSVARHAIRGLPSWVADEEQKDRLELIASETVTNAIRHGSTDPGAVVELEVKASSNVVEGWVRDQGPPFELPSPADNPGTPRVGGYGLFIVSQVAATVTVDRTDHGNEVRFTV